MSWQTLTELINYMMGTLDKKKNTLYEHLVTKLVVLILLIYHFETVPNSKKLQTTTENVAIKGF